MFLHICAVLLLCVLLTVMQMAYVMWMIVIWAAVCRILQGAKLTPCGLAEALLRTQRQCHVLSAIATRYGCLLIGIVSVICAPFAVLKESERACTIVFVVYWVVAGICFIRFGLL